MPIAFRSALDSWKNRTTEARVISGVEVGNCAVLRSSGPVPIPQTNLVPPASIAPNMLLSI